MAMTQANTYISVSTPLGKDKFILRAFRGEEALSAPFHFILDCLAQDPVIPLIDLTGKKATIEIKLDKGAKRYLNGVIARCVWVGMDNSQDKTEYAVHYQLELRPFFWLASLFTDNRVYQNKTTKQIIEAIFKEMGFKDFKFQLKGSYQPRLYVVQYQESNFDFISRLLEDDGVFYFFEHTKDKHTMVFADDADAFTPAPGVTDAKFGTNLFKREYIAEARWEALVRPNAYALSDNNPETATTELFVKTKTANPFSGTLGGNKLTLYDFPSAQLKKAEGEKKLKVRIEAAEHSLRTLRGKGNFRAFGAGHTFKLAGHPRPGRNGQYVLRWVCHNAAWNTYSNAFEAFPKSVPYRPPLITKRPEVCGCSAIATATVVGPTKVKPGEPYVDKMGRVKIQFHWEQKDEDAKAKKKDDKSSCWVRVTQSVSGKNFGTWFIPRVGQEVLVNFIGMVPIVVGAIYNSENMPAYPLPANQSKSWIKTLSTPKGGGFNEIRFEDKKGSEELFVHAEQDHNIKVEHNQKAEVGNSMFEISPYRQLDHGHRKVTIHEGKAKVKQGTNPDGSVKWGWKKIPGKEEFYITKGPRIIEVQKGDETHKVNGLRTLEVTKAEEHTNKADFKHTVKGNYTLKVTGNLTIDVGGDITIKSSKNINMKAGMNFEQKAGMNLKMKAGIALVSEAGVQLKQKGVMVAVEAGAMLTLKGALVKIN